MYINEMNQHVISDGYSLAVDFKQSSKDGIEKTLNRGQGLISAFVGSFFVGTFSFPGLCLLNDADMDGVKLKFIHAKKLSLNETAGQLETNGQDHDKAMQSIEFQRSVYENVEKYTEAARKVKLIAGISLTFIGISIQALAVAGLLEIDVPQIAQEILTWTTLGSLAIGVPATAYWAYQKLTFGSKTDQQNQALTELALNQLSPEKLRNF